MTQQKHIILDLENIHNLFEQQAINPLKKREMQGSGMDTLYMRVRLHSPEIPPLLILNLPHGTYNPAEIEAAVKKYCITKIETAKTEHQILKKERYVGILTGFFFLTLCLVASYLLMMQESYSEFVKFYIKEGLFIVGWVSMWRPTEILLFDWWPYRKYIRTYEYIQSMRVEISVRPISPAVKNPENAI